MKQLHSLWNMAATLLLAGGLLSSCSQEEQTQGSGTPLPDGEYPLRLSASVAGAVQTRTEGKDCWWGDGTEYIAVSADETTYKYKITDTSGSTEFADDTQEPFYWQNTTQTATVTAWYPYADKTDVDITRQDAMTNLSEIDFLKADRVEDANYKTDIALTFKHQMAKVSYTLVPGDGVVNEDLENSTVSIAGYTKASFTEGALTGTEDGWITPTTDCEALLVPQDMTGKAFIKVGINGNEFIYTPEDGAANLQPGTRYTYTITMKANGIEVTEAVGGEWTEGGSENVGIAVIYDGTETEAKIGDYYYSDGTWSDGGLRKLYADGTMEWAETTPQPEKTTIGIVFYTGRHPSDNSDYSRPLTENGPTISDNKVHGYVVALTDVHNGNGDRLRWEYGQGNVYDQRVNASTSTSDWQGYSNHQKFHEFVNAETNKAAGWEMKHFPAALACETYGNQTTDHDGNTTTAYDWQNPLAAPTNTSGWFLPSFGQLSYLYANRFCLSDRIGYVKNNTPDGCSYKDYIKWFVAEIYWSSSESKSSHEYACSMSFLYGNLGSPKKFYENYVRAILVF